MSTRLKYLIFLLSLAALFIRIAVNSDSLWYDELYTIAFHVSRPLSSIIFGSNPGTVPGYAIYSPNNHLLSTLLIKLTANLTDSLAAFPDFPIPVLLTKASTLAFRLPALLAGAALPLALIWTLLPRQSNASKFLLPAAAVALITLFHPWLIVFSTEARGYSLALIFAAVATNCLPQFQTRLSWQYILAMLAAIYCLPIAIEILPGHALALFLLYRKSSAPSKLNPTTRFAIAAAITLVVSALLYAPFASGITHYAGSESNAHISMPTLMTALGAHLALGWQPENPANVAAAITALVLLLAGIPLAWRFSSFRLHLLSYATATLVALTGALFIPNLQVPRLILWSAPLQIFALAGIILAIAGPTSLHQHPRKFAAIAAALAVGVPFLLADYQLMQIPPQPIYQALILADDSLEIRGDNDPARIVGISLSAREALLYRPSLHHSMSIAYSLDDLKNREQSKAELRLVVFYPQILLATDPALAAYINTHYVPLQTLHGRISDVTVYAANKK